MKMLSRFITLFLFSFSAFANDHYLITKVEYGAQKEFEGSFVSSKKIKKSAPGILMIHNWKGPSDETLSQAKRYVDLGYSVFIADIYGKGIRPNNPKDAGAESTKYKTDRNEFRKRLNLGLETLKKQKNVDSKKLAAIGYCFGGTGVIELARSGAQFNGAISYHGGLDSPQPNDGKNIQAKLLVHHGAVDPFVPAKELNEFEAELNSHKVDYQLIKYANSVHSFTDKGAGDDNSKGAAYNKTADERSFEISRLFLAEIFR